MPMPDSVRDVLEQISQEEKKCLQRLAELRASKLTVMRINGIEPESNGSTVADLQPFPLPDSAPSASPATPGAKPTIRPDEFFGDTHAEASRKYLKKVGFAVSFAELADVLKKGGCKLTSPDPEHVLWISLIRNSRDFVSPQKGFVGLREFYGANVRPRETKPAKPSRSKNKKHRKTTSKPQQKAIASKSTKQRKSDEPQKEKPEQQASGVREAVYAFMGDRQFHALDEVKNAASKKVGIEISQIQVRGVLSSKKVFEKNEEGLFRMKAN